MVLLNFYNNGKGTEQFGRIIIFNYLNLNDFEIDHQIVALIGGSNLILNNCSFYNINIQDVYEYINIGNQKEKRL